MVTIPWLGVILAALSTFIIGSLWYSPTFFLRSWQKMTGTTDADMKKKFGTSMAYMAVIGLVGAYILAHFIAYTQQATGISGISAGLQTAFWAWLGFSVTTTIAHGSLEARDSKVMVINAGNRLVTFLVMGLIIGAFM
jgi:hypothetical protein